MDIGSGFSGSLPLPIPFSLSFSLSRLAHCSSLQFCLLPLPPPPPPQVASIDKDVNTIHDAFNGTITIPLSSGESVHSVDLLLFFDIELQVCGHFLFFPLFFPSDTHSHLLLIFHSLSLSLSLP